MSDPFREGPPAARARQRRSLMIALALIGFCVLLFVITVIRLGAQAGAAPHG